MRTWERVAYLEHCGGCGAVLMADTPMQTITRHGLTRKLIRCVLCADGAAPPDLPTRPVMLSVQERVAQIAMKPITAVEVPRTRGAFKQFAAEWMPFKENREPGEDDE